MLITNILRLLLYDVHILCGLVETMLINWHESRMVEMRRPILHIHTAEKCRNWRCNRARNTIALIDGTIEMHSCRA